MNLWDLVIVHNNANYHLFKSESGDWFLVPVENYKKETNDSYYYDEANMTNLESGNTGWIYVSE